MTFGTSFGSTEKTSESMDPDIKNRLLDLFGDYPGVTDDLVERLNEGYKKYTGDRYGDEVADQEAYYNYVRNNLANIPGKDVWDASVSAAQNLPSNRVDPVTGKIVGQQAFGGDGTTPLATGARQSIQDVIAKQFKDTNISDYQNPYTTQVIDRALSDLDRATQMRMQAADDRATGARAFGGDRAAIERGMIDQESIRQAGTMAANLRARGYEDAASRVEQDISNQLTADQANQLADAQTTRDAMTIAADLAGQNQREGRIAATDEAMNQLRSSQALLNAFGQGSDAYREYLADFADIGDRQYAFDQRDKDFDFEEFARTVDYDQNMITNMINLLRAAPGDKTQEKSTELDTFGKMEQAMNLYNMATGSFDSIYDKETGEWKWPWEKS